jgi:hypothetical protein
MNDDWETIILKRSFSNDLTYLPERDGRGHFPVMMYYWFNPLVRFGYVLRFLRFVPGIRGARQSILQRVAYLLGHAFAGLTCYVTPYKALLW